VLCGTILRQADNIKTYWQRHIERHYEDQNRLKESMSLKNIWFSENKVSIQRNAIKLSILFFLLDNARGTT